MNPANATWRNGGLWALFPAAILVPLVGGQLYLVHRALSDPSFAVEDRYYAKAVSWDSSLAERQANDQLGWQARATVARTSDGKQSVSFALVDRQRVPVRGARVEADAFAVARSSRAIHLTLSETEPGSYASLLNADRPGLWEISFRATRGTDRFTSVSRNDIPEVHP